MSANSFYKRIVILSSALCYAPWQFRQSCWSADIVLRLRQGAKSSSKGYGWLLAKSLLMPLRLQCATVMATTIRAGSNQTPGAKGTLLNQREVLIRESDLLSTGGRREAGGGARDVQEACLRALYWCLVQKVLPNDAVRPMTRYYYATDAMRDLFDYCYSLGRLHSTTAVASSVRSFTDSLLARIADTHSEALPRGRLPMPGSFASGLGYSSKGMVNTLVNRYWSEDHLQRANLEPNVFVPLEADYETFTQQLGTRTVRSMLCHEMAIQGLIELDSAYRSTGGMPDAQQFTRAARRLFQAAERLSYGWTLPD